MSMTNSKSTIGKFFRFTVGMTVYFIDSKNSCKLLEVPVKDEVYHFRIRDIGGYAFSYSPDEFYAQIDYQKTFDL